VTFESLGLYATPVIELTWLRRWEIQALYHALIVALV